MSISLEAALDKAEENLGKGHIKEAEKIFRSVLVVFPEDKRAAEGIQKIQQIEASYPSSKSTLPQEKVHEIIGLYNQGRFMEVIQKAEETTRFFTPNITLLNLIGAANASLKNFNQAIEVFKKILAINPKDAMAYYNIGNIYKEKGYYDLEIESYKKALLIQPNHAQSYNNMGKALKAKGDLDAAIEQFKNALNIETTFAEAHYNLGVALQEKGNLNAAIQSYKKACEIKPDNTKYHFFIGNAYKNNGDPDAAINSYKQAIKTAPNDADLYNNMGNILRDNGQLDAAIDSYRNALKIKPKYAEVYNNKGVALMEKGELDAAINSCKQAIKIKPDYAEAYNSMGLSLKEKGESDAAIDSYKEALKIKPDYADAYYNMGIVLEDKGEIDAAIDNYKQAIKIKPDHAGAHYNQSEAYLSKGDFKNGWIGYDWRWQNSPVVPALLSAFKPEWKPTSNDRVLLWGEQGIGDQIMFASLIPELLPLCSKIIIQVDSRLIPIFKRSFPDTISYYPLSEKVPEKKYDSQISMGSLPKYLRNNLDSFKKSSHGYLCADRERAKCIREALLSDGTEFLYGVAWRGGKEEKIKTEQRRIQLTKIASVLTSKNVKLVSLQYGEIEQEIAELKEKLGINVITVPEVDNFKDIDGLAALIEACDVVVSVASSTANLAGAQNKKTAVLLPFLHNWRWQFMPPESYWYSSVRLFRQEQDGSWDQSISEAKYFALKQ